MWPHGARSVWHWDYCWSCLKRSRWKKKNYFLDAMKQMVKKREKVFRSPLLSILRFRVNRTTRTRMLNAANVFTCLSAQPRISTHFRNNRPAYRPEKLISAQPPHQKIDIMTMRLKKTKFYYDFSPKTVRIKWIVKNLLWNIITFCCKIKNYHSAENLDNLIGAQPRRSFRLK